jgi:hypothetical protein
MGNYIILSKYKRIQIFFSQKKKKFKFSINSIPLLLTLLHSFLEYKIQFYFIFKKSQLQ